MQEKKYTATDKVVHKMSKNGLTEENLRTGERESIHEWQKSRGRPADGVPNLTPEQAQRRSAIKKAMVKQYAEKKQKKEAQLQEAQQENMEQAGERSQQEALSQQADEPAEEESLEAAEDVKESAVNEDAYSTGRPGSRKRDVRDYQSAQRKKRVTDAAKEKPPNEPGPEGEAETRQNASAKGKAAAGKGNKNADKKTDGKGKDDAKSSGRKSKLNFEDEDSGMVRGNGMGFHKKAAYRYRSCQVLQF